MGDAKPISGEHRLLERTADSLKESEILKDLHRLPNAIPTSGKSPSRAGSCSHFPCTPGGQSRPSRSPGTQTIRRVAGLDDICADTRQTPT